MEGMEPEDSSRGNPLHAIHGKENGGESHALAVRLVDGADKVVERVEVDAAHGNAGLIEDQQLAPKFLLGRVQAHDNDGMNVHGFHAQRTIRVTHFLPME